MSITFPYPFGKYVLLNRIALGGMAEIFRAKTIGAEGFEKEVVIKRILSSYSEDEAFVNMFIDEAKIAAELHHANIVQIFDFDKFEDCYYIAMEYVEGKDLRKILDQGLKINRPLSPMQVVHIMIEVSKGLEYAHTKTGKLNQPLNIIHRDISPHNIMISYNGEVKLTDFGIAKAAARSTKTRAGTVKGKCSYMSPEQARGKEIDQRSDIFSLGTVMWEALTQKKLFDGETDFEILTNVFNANIIPPSKVVKGVSKELDKILLKALERDREKRYQSAGAFLKDLQNFFFRNVTNIEEIAIDRYMQSIFFEEIRTLHELGISSEQPVLKEEGVRKAQASQVSVGKGEIQAAEEKSAPLAKRDISEEPTPLPVDAEAMTTLLPSGALETQEMFDKRESAPDAATIALNAESLQNNKTLPLTGELVSELRSALERGEKREHLSSPSREVYKTPAKGGEPVAAQTRSKPVVVRTDPELKARRGISDSKFPRAAGAKRYIWLFASLILAGAILGWLGVYLSSSTEIPDKPVALLATDASATRDSGSVQTVDSTDTAALSAKFEKTAKPAETVPAVEEKPRVEEAKFASLTLSVSPKNAAVKINGEPVPNDSGRIEIKSRFRAGETITISSSHSGYNDYSTSYKVSDGENRLSIALTPVAQPKKPVTKVETGYVFINAKPWAYVYFNGRKIGTTPVRNFKAPVGVQKFTLKNQTVSKVVEVTIEKGKKKSVVVDMQK